MPVSKISVLGSRSVNLGVSRWIGQRSVSAGSAGPPSTGSPSTLRIRPRAALPTGAVIAEPVSTADMPRVTPSVLLMATARTWFCPMCCCTSAVRRTGTAPLASSSTRAL